MTKRIAILSLLVVGCATHSPAPERTPFSPPSAIGVRSALPSASASASAEENIDFLGLQHSLGLDRSDDELGFREKAFNTCGAGYGYSGSGNCRSRSFVVMNLRLLCRPTEDTDSTILTSADLSPIGGRDVTWHLKGASGVARTDGAGYFQIRTALPASARAERMRLTVGNDFLVMRAGEMGRLVTPKSWCP